MNNTEETKVDNNNTNTEVESKTFVPSPVWQSHFTTVKAPIATPYTNGNVRKATKKTATGNQEGSKFKPTKSTNKKQQNGHQSSKNAGHKANNTNNNNNRNNNDSNTSTKRRPQKSNGNSTHSTKGRSNNNNTTSSNNTTNVASSKRNTNSKNFKSQNGKPSNGRYITNNSKTNKKTTSKPSAKNVIAGINAKPTLPQNHQPGSYAEAIMKAPKPENKKKPQPGSTTTGSVQPDTKSNPTQQ